MKKCNTAFQGFTLFFRRLNPLYIKGDVTDVYALSSYACELMSLGLILFCLDFMLLVYRASPLPLKTRVDFNARKKQTNIERSNSNIALGVHIYLSTTWLSGLNKARLSRDQREMSVLRCLPSHSSSSSGKLVLLPGHVRESPVHGNRGHCTPSSLFRAARDPRADLVFLPGTSVVKMRGSSTKICVQYILPRKPEHFMLSLVESP
ncbi:hypothetical protein J6590_046411 [Homalodisca vitripennis]|nr:hypothetical protein J6590_046411 [Homalodisca vitripennis]